MAGMDARTKEYVRDPYVFADLFNYLIYDGKPVLKPENLTEQDTLQLALPYGREGASIPVQRTRDVLKSAVLMTGENARYLAILGVENQLKVHYAMPVRNMLYDAIHYADQVSRAAASHKASGDKATGEEYLSGFHRTDRLLPIVTLVVLFNSKAWDAPTSIHEMLATQDEALLRHIPDYKLNLIVPAAMSDEDFAKFQSDFREVAAYIRYEKDPECLDRLVETDDRFRHMRRSTAELINEVTGSGLTLKGEEEVNMCQAIAEMKTLSAIEAWVEAVKNIQRKLNLSVAEAISFVEVPEAYRAAVEAAL